MAVGLFAVANAAQLPFSETFDGLTIGSLSNQNEWVVQSGTAIVQTNVVLSGKAVLLNSSSVTRALVNTNSSMWLTFWARYTGLPSQNPDVTTNIRPLWAALTLFTGASSLMISLRDRRVISDWISLMMDMTYLLGLRGLFTAIGSWSQAGMSRLA